MKISLILTILMASLVSEAAELVVVTGTVTSSCVYHDRDLLAEARRKAESSVPNHVRVSDWREKVVYPLDPRRGNQYRNVDDQGCESQKVATAQAAFVHVKEMYAPWILKISAGALTANRVDAQHGKDMAVARAEKEAAAFCEVVPGSRKLLHYIPFTTHVGGVIDHYVKVQFQCKNTEVPS